MSGQPVRGPGDRLAVPSLLGRCSEDPCSLRGATTLQGPTCNGCECNDDQDMMPGSRQGRSVKAEIHLSILRVINVGAADRSSLCGTTDPMATVNDHSLSLNGSSDAPSLRNGYVATRSLSLKSDQRVAAHDGHPRSEVWRVGVLREVNRWSLYVHHIGAR